MMNPGRPVTRRDPDLLTCPTCGTRLTVDQSPTPPFCSTRCQQIDLGRWMNEEIGLPHESRQLDAEDFRDPEAY